MLAHLKPGLPLSTFAFGAKFITECTQVTEGDTESFILLFSPLCPRDSRSLPQNANARVAQLRLSATLISTGLAVLSVTIIPSALRGK